MMIISLSAFLTGASSFFPPQPLSSITAASSPAHIFFFMGILLAVGHASGCPFVGSSGLLMGTQPSII